MAEETLYWNIMVVRGFRFNFVMQVLIHWFILLRLKAFWWKIEILSTALSAVSLRVSGIARICKTPEKDLMLIKMLFKKFWNLSSCIYLFAFFPPSDVCSFWRKLLNLSKYNLKTTKNTMQIRTDNQCKTSLIALNMRWYRLLHEWEVQIYKRGIALE